ncbi:MAG: hypothetical protein MJE68_22440 [Proteobacteria bacterium]|nr:hypothetical protein [Pseudomonadota bacterium]
MPRTTKPSPNGTAPKISLLEMVKDIAFLKAGKLDWWTAVKSQAIIIAFMLSIMAGGFGFVYYEVKGVETRLMTEISLVKDDIAEVKENQARSDERQIRIEDKLDTILRQNRALLGESNTTIIETPVDAPSTAPYTTPINPTPVDAPANTPYTAPNTPNTNLNPNTPTTNPIKENQHVSL